MLDTLPPCKDPPSSPSLIAILKHLRKNALLGNQQELIALCHEAAIPDF